MKTNVKRVLVALLALLVVALAVEMFSVKREPVAAQPACDDCNVILIAMDTLRADHLGAYGYGRDTSPNIDAFAKDALRFVNFYSNAPWTLPSFSTMFTSLYPSDVKMQLPADRLDERFTTLAEVLKQNGYATVGFNSPSPVSRNGGFFQGFDSFTVVEPDEHNRDTTLIVPQALDWLDDNKGSKFFMFLHTFEVHDPFCPPTDFDRFHDGDTSADLNCVDIVAISKHNRREDEFSPQDLARVVSLYDGDLSHADRGLGELFERLRADDLYRNTIVVITADHGEELGEHQVVGHAYSLHTELMHVPLVIKAPNLPPGVERKRASTIDIAPTVLQLLGISKPPQFKGKSLTGLDGDRVIYQETSAPLELVKLLDRIIASPQAGQSEVRQTTVPTLKESIIHSNWRYSVDHTVNRAELYDLESDPREERNLIGTDKPQERTLEELLESVRP